MRYKESCVTDFAPFLSTIMNFNSANNKKGMLISYTKRCKKSGTKIQTVKLKLIKENIILELRDIEKILYLTLGLITETGPLQISYGRYEPSFVP